VSELAESGGSRRRRADARRSAQAILDAAIVLLGRHHDASMDDVASAAGVARQTVYAHYPNREALLGAVIDRTTADVRRALDQVDLDGGSATDALRRWLQASWQLIEQYPILLSPVLAASDPRTDHDRHIPIIEGLYRLIQRGQQVGEFDPAPAADWLVAATIGLGHAAGQEASAGRMSVTAAGAAFRDSVLRITLVAGDS
jgi:AcrR family transcriptional regulator